MFPTSSSVPAAIFIRVMTEMVGGREVVECLVMRYEKRMTLRQIADTMSMDHSTVGRRMMRARKSMENAGVWPRNWL